MAGSRPTSSTPSFPAPQTQTQNTNFAKPAFTSAANSILTQVPKAADPIRKSHERPFEVSDEIISDHIKDDYEDDFENIEESSRIKNAGKGAARNTGFGSGKGSGEPEESSGGFDEKYDEDFF